MRELIARDFDKNNVCGDEWDGKTKRTIEGRMKGDGISTKTMHRAMNGVGRQRGR